MTSPVHPSTSRTANPKGFTLIEMALVVLILGILATIAMPGYRDYAEKAQLTDLELRIDAMRTAMATAYQTGVRSMMIKAAYPPGMIPDAWRAIPIRDSMAYPGLEMFMMSSDQTFGQFAGGTMRPYLVLGAAGSASASSMADNARTLRNFSDILPAAIQSWWVPSTIMVIPLLDDTVINIANTAATNPATSAATASGGSATGSPPSSTGSTPANTGSSPANTGTGQSSNTGTGNPPATTAQGGTTPAGTTNSGTTAPAVVVANTPPVVPAVQGCNHPGNGHAWGRCRNRP